MNYELSSQTIGADSSKTNFSNLKKDSISSNSISTPTTSIVKSDTTAKLNVLPKTKSDTITKAKAVVTKSKKMIEVDFLLPEVEYEQMAVISNVLRVKNNSAKTYIFTVKLSLPSGWRTLNRSDKNYTIAPNDSAYVAIRLITSNKSAKGGTKYNILSFISSEAGVNLGSSSFLAGRPKISNWQMHILPRPRIYFLNNQTETPFQINLSNDGDEQEQVILSMNKIGRDFTVSDSSGKFLKKNYLDFILKPQSDTIVPFNIKIHKPMPNLKRIDTYGYRSNTIMQEKRYGIFFKASEVSAKPGKTNNKSGKADFIKLANSIDFVKLNDVTKINPYNGSFIPLTMIANIYNILGQQPVMNLVFQGNTTINSKSRMDYFLQTGLAYYKYDSRVFNSSSGMLNYNHDKFFFSLGSGVGLNVNNLRGITSGRGISGGYNISKTQTAGAYFLRNGQSFFNFQSSSLGAAYEQRLKKITFGAGIDATNYIAGNSTQALNANIMFPITRNQSIGLMGQYTLINFNGGNYNTNFFSINYSIRYLKDKASTSLNYNQIEGNASTGLGQIFTTYSHNIDAAIVNSYRFKKGHELRLNNNLNLFRVPNYSYDNLLFTNVLSMAFPVKTKVNYTPGLYFNYSSYFTERLLATGAQLSVNTSNIDENFRFGLFLRGGYNSLVDFQNLGTFFTAQTNTYLSYRTWNLFLRYFYGPQGVSNIVYSLNNQKIYAQTISGSISNQYQFKNKHFVWENTLNYTYLNVNRRHNMGLFSQLFYYTDGGWRFNLNFTYSYNIFDTYKYTYSPGNQATYYEASNERQSNQNFQLGVGVLKDFAIPIPKKFRKVRFVDVKFKTFLDLNGNKKFDQDEVSLENIVIRLNDNEVLTNINGEASFLNSKLGAQKLQVISLIDIGAWFPVVSDSVDIVGENTLFIPFSQGVQILGNVHLDREKFSGDIQANLDISRMKIFLVDSLGKVITSVTDKHGDFKFYVPYGNYTLKFDEKVLGAGFELVQNDIPVLLVGGVESFSHTFFIVEKRRKISKKKFDENGNVIESKEENATPRIDLKKDAPNKNKLFDADGKLLNPENTSGLKNNSNNSSNDSNNDSSNSKNNKNSKNTKNAKNNNSPANSDNTNENTPNSGSPDKSNNSASSRPIESKVITAAKMDSIIGILKGKIKPNKTLTQNDLAKIQEFKNQKNGLAQYNDKTLFMVQIGAFSKNLPNSLLAALLNLDIKLASYKDNNTGLTKYFSGNYVTQDDAIVAKNEIVKRGLNGSFVKVVSIKNGVIISPAN